MASLPHDDNPTMNGSMNHNGNPGADGGADAEVDDEAEPWPHVFENFVINGDADFERISKEHEQKNDIAAAKLADIANDRTYPHSDAQMTAYKNLLCHAFVNFGGIVEKSKRFEVNRIRDLEPVEVELLCYQIVKEMKAAHRGELGLPPFVKDREVLYEHFATFNERFGKTFEVVLRSKAIAHGAIPRSFIRRLVAAPNRELRVLPTS
ncbi:hypothetical protein QBC34DRAFT_383697 [Podospora aff. communis PSN243]|uniref:Uncharacterized protein n=1 Tax=Podospora aff. communis PSN243 TaxID=3040156 RepID=A0AAV9GDU2_9PEZI|nr:hypothetical protein QBC34DRAFT_383697 [Podospora aff. communis PSN243]